VAARNHVSARSSDADTLDRSCQRRRKSWPRATGLFASFERSPAKASIDRPYSGRIQFDS
jgi:hypothetical protein